jgi:hypothetical protein
MANRRREHLFLVRMWTDDLESSATSSWRGSVRHVASGRTFFVVGPSEVADFITLRLGDTPQAGDTTDADASSEDDSEEAISPS